MADKKEVEEVSESISLEEEEEKTSNELEVVVNDEEETELNSEEEPFFQEAVIRDEEHQEEKAEIESVDIVENGPSGRTSATPPLILTSNGTNGTTNETQTTAAVGAAVAVDRKQKLLLEARRDRLEWIQKVPLPYTVADKVDGNSSGILVWSSHPKLDLLRSSRIATEAPTVLHVLASLYNHDSAEMQRQIPVVLDSLDNSKQAVALAIPSGREILEKEILKQRTLDSPLGQIAVQFQSFLLKMEKPECAMIVQGMRNFCRHVSSRQQQPGTDGDESVKLAASVNSYISATFSSIQSHPAWAKDENDKDCRRSLESFIYGQVKSTVKTLLFREEEIKVGNDEWAERLRSLKFITPKHLELECFLHEEDDASSSVEILLEDPLQMLWSVDCFHSPYEKLQRILGVYHGVNAALTKALNDDSKKDKILPSADHVLPTLIMVVLLAQPTDMVFNLKFVELYCPPEYLRGEAGYAFTNLYGAIQFLRDLNIDDSDEGANALHMSPQEFRDGLEECRNEAQQLLNISPSEQELVSDRNVQPCQSMTPPNLSASKVRAVRLRGGVVDIDWAITEWQRKQQNDGYVEMANQQEGSSDKSEGESSSVPYVQEAAALSRSYSFLTTRPEDVKISDLPLLLKEYRSLVHTTEVLLAERTSRLNSERKRQLAKERKALEKDAEAVNFEVP